MQLAIDTSTATASIALSQKDEVIAEMTWHSEQNQTVELLPNLIHLLSQTKTSLRSLDGIYIAKGPGSFNGLRVGVSTAKGLAFALDIPLVGIVTLEIEALPHAQTALLICPVLNAGRGEVATAQYQLREGRWQQLLEPHLTTVDALCSQTAAKTVFCGEITPAISAELQQKLKGLAVIPPPAGRLRRAGFLAQLGYIRLERCESEDPTTLQPLYLRRPPITEPRPKRLFS